MNIVACETEHFDALVRFVGHLNADPAHHIGYFGTHPVDIAQTLQALNPPPHQGFRLAYDDGQLVGVLGVEADVDLGRAWLYGPLIDHEAWDVISDRLYSAVMPAIPAGVFEHELFCDAGNLHCQAFARRHDFPLHGEAAILNFPRERLASVPDATAPELEARHFDAFQTLHSRLFPRTGYSAQQIVDRRGDTRTFVVDGDGLQGYIVCKVEPAAGEGYIDYIGVAETARRGGIGRRLLAAALRWMFSYPAIQHVHLTVTTRNEAALALYTALGFDQERIMRAFRKQVSV